jgi:hypothetical protein
MLAAAGSVQMLIAGMAFEQFQAALDQFAEIATDLKRPR